MYISLVNILAHKVVFQRSSAVRARELCSAAAKAAKEAEAAALPVAESGTSGLSVEAVTAHTAQTLTPAGANAGGSVIGAPSLLAKEGRKTSTIGGTRGHGTQAAKNLPAVQQSPPATPPPAVPAGRKLSVSASVGGEYGLYSCVLPEDLLVELLAERLQVSLFIQHSWWIPTRLLELLTLLTFCLITTI